MRQFSNNARLFLIVFLTSVDIKCFGDNRHSSLKYSDNVGFRVTEKQIQRLALEKEYILREDLPPDFITFHNFFLLLCTKDLSVALGFN